MEPLAWVTGARGLIGNEVVRMASICAPGWRIRALRREQIDLRDRALVDQAFAAERPDLIIHCAALSSSPECQRSPALAHTLNVAVTRHLAELAGNGKLIFLSTDLVFDGKDGNYDEAAAVNPLNIYGETKVLAERFVLQHSAHVVVRTSLNGGVSFSKDRGFNEQLRRSWQQGQVTRLFTDEFRSPIHARVTARALWELAASRNSGIFHVAGTQRLSRWQIGQIVACRCPELHPKLESASLKEYSGPPRGPDSSLNCAKVQKVISFRLPGLNEWLEANPSETF